MTTMVLGILTGENNARSPYVRSLIRTANELGAIAYGFTAQALVNLDARSVDGYDGSSDRGLSRQPFPTAVYNRVPTRREEGSTEVKHTKEVLRTRAVRYFNERFFNKREVDQVLRTDAETVALLPDTLTTWDVNAAAAMLERYGMLYVKPISGSFGEGICQLTQESGRYRLDVRGSLGVVTRYFTHWRECLDACRAQMGGGPCIIQEGIRLGLFDDCKTDFRVHVHHGLDDRWRVVAIAAKVANRQAITTHVHSGGHVEVGDVVLDRWFGANRAEVKHRLEQSASAVCERLATALDPSLGELGLDMGIAQDGRVVLFEANAKPGRAIFAHRDLREAGSVSRRQVFAHAQFLETRSQIALKQHIAFVKNKTFV